MFSQLFNQIIDKIKLKAQNNEIKQTEHKMFFGYPVSDLDIDLQDKDVDRAELESEFYDVIQACEVITEDQIKELSELKFDNIIEQHHFDVKQRQIFVNIMYYRWLDMQ